MASKNLTNVTPSQWGITHKNSNMQKNLLFHSLERISKHVDIWNGQLRFRLGSKKWIWKCSFEIHFQYYIEIFQYYFYGNPPHWRVSNNETEQLFIRASNIRTLSMFRANSPINFVFTVVKTKNLTLNSVEIL